MHHVACPALSQDWLVCFGQLCQNTYCVDPIPIANSDYQVCLCMAQDFSCLPVTEETPTTCSCLPACFVYPKFACCPKASDLVPQVTCFPPLFLIEASHPLWVVHAQATLHNVHKRDAYLCFGCCFPCSCCAQNCYCLRPYTCCADEGSQFLCFAWDCVSAYATCAIPHRKLSVTLRACGYNRPFLAQITSHVSAPSSPVALCIRR